MVESHQTILASSGVPSALDLANSAEQDREFWLYDGNVILVAGRVKFLVHEGLLAAHSPIFADMFKLAKPSQVEMTDGCKIVVMCETPEDVRHVLRVLIMFKISPTVNGYPDYETLSALVRSSHKYAIHGLLRQSLAYLQHHFTTDLETWCASPPCHVPDSFKPVHAIGVVNLAHLLSILPTALSVCCLLSGKDLIHGFERADGTREMLSDEDLALVLDAKHHFMETMTALTLRVRVFDQYVYGVWCTSTDACRRAACLALYRFEAAPGLLANAHPFDPWEKYVPYCDAPASDPDSEGWDCPTVKMCTVCSQFREDRFKKEQREIWKTLPAVFELQIPGWGDQEP